MTLDLSPPPLKTLRDIVGDFYPEPPSPPPNLVEEVYVEPGWFESYKVFLEAQLEVHRKSIDRCEREIKHYRKVLSQAKRWEKTIDAKKDYALAYKAELIVDHIKFEIERRVNSVKRSKHYIPEYEEELKNLTEESAVQKRKERISKDNEYRKENYERQIQEREHLLAEREKAFNSLKAPKKPKKGEK